ncbi:uncharacterized protein A4U43_C09F16100 [Asparagus officinalis]|uniref:Uncharacterized protein n=1 Tax=Asparagus officinalis TaxID=4686 RepID=A0A5P1E9V0_ASPOF|nr:uncharacterized protein A4U43_C09F16100 [Asparagus officinalis]
MKLREIGEEETLYGTISDLVATGSSRARRKARGILERIRKSMHATHYSCVFFAIVFEYCYDGEAPVQRWAGFRIPNAAGAHDVMMLMMIDSYM